MLVHRNRVDYTHWKSKIDDLSFIKTKIALVAMLNNATLEQALRIARKCENLQKRKKT